MEHPPESIENIGLIIDKKDSSFIHSFLLLKNMILMVLDLPFFVLLQDLAHFEGEVLQGERLLNKVYALGQDARWVMTLVV